MRRIAGEVNDLAPFDVVIHNAGVIEGPALIAVNVVAFIVFTIDFFLFMKSGRERSR